MVSLSWILLFVGFLVADASVLIGPKECTFGPSFWCDSLRNAKTCSAVRHCIQTVWELQKLPEDVDGICKTCKGMVTEAKNVISSDAAEVALRTIVNNTCEKLAFEDLVKECIQYGDADVEEFRQLVSSKMEPQAVCAALELCNSYEIDRRLQEMKTLFLGQKPPTNKPCSECRHYAREIVKLVKFFSREQIENVLLSLCGRLGSMSDSCQVIIRTNFNAIYAMLLTIDPDSFCHSIGFCDTSNEITSAVSIFKTGDEPCDFCVAVVQNWKDEMENKKTKQQLRELLNSLCDQTGAFRGECRSLVDEYYDAIYEVLVSDIKPKEVCEAVGFCGKTSVFNSELPLWTTFEMKPFDSMPPVESNLIGNDEAASYRTKNKELPTVHLSKTDIDVEFVGKNGFIKIDHANIVKLSGEDYCLICEFVLHLIQNYLEDKPTEEEIIEEVDRMCTHLPKSIVEDCQDYVDAYGPMMIQLLIQGIDPSIICPKIHACPGPSTTPRPKEVGDACLVCKFTITELEDELKDNKTEESIKSALETLCSKLPNSFQSQCNDLVDQYTDLIIQTIIKDYTPEEVCQEIGLCNGKKKALPPLTGENAQLPLSRMFISPPLETSLVVTPNIELQQSKFCILCEFIIRELENELLTNSSVAEIEQALDRVCLHLPSTLMDDCLGLLEEYTKPLLEWLVIDAKPSTICRKLRLCKDTFSNAMPRAIRTVKKPNCDQCNVVVGFHKLHKEMNGITADLDELTNTICDLIGGNCKEFVKEFGQSLLQEIAKSPYDKVCKNLSCTSPQSELVGSSHCTWGPSFWCRSKINAAYCSVTEHCEEYGYFTSTP